jgi:hypothetical protein
MSATVAYVASGAQEAQRGAMHFLSLCFPWSRENRPQGSESSARVGVAGAPLKTTVAGECAAAAVRRLTMAKLLMGLVMMFERWERER